MLFRSPDPERSRKGRDRYTHEGGFGLVIRLQFYAFRILLQSVICKYANATSP